MRNVRILCGAVLALASASAAGAQQAPPALNATAVPAAEPKQAGPSGPQIILRAGYRFSWSDGDEARWERYRDLRDGIVVGASFNQVNDNAGLSFDAANVAYHDQEYAANFNQFGKLKAFARWNSIPLNYAYNTLTPWVDAGNNIWTLNQATRTDVQNKVPGVLGIGSNATHYNQASVYRGISELFGMQSRRDILALGVKYRVSDAVRLDLGFNTTKRGGTMPFGSSFAFNNGNEHPVTLDDRTNDMSAAVEWAKPSKGMLRLEWLGSRYNNEFLSLTWDNPLRATDYTNGKAPPLGPYDPSGYSNGNGPAFGRMALPPSNTMNSFTLLGLHKLPGRTRLNGSLNYTLMRQDEELIPWTTNTVIASPVVFAAFPNLARLPRSTADAEVRQVNALLNFTTRPTDYLAFDMRYRFNDRDNRTALFDATEYVRFDAVPEETGAENTGHNVRHSTFETGATFDGVREASIRVAYLMDDVKRTERVYSGMTDYTFRLSLDTHGSQYFSFRGLYENTQRKGTGFSLEALEEGGAQPALRFYDEAPLSRNKGQVILQVTPNDKVDVGLTFAAWKDDYNDDEQQFGLLDNSNTSYNVTLDTNPFEKVTFGGNFAYEKLGTLQKSRNANPFSGVAGAYESWNDPNRDWNLDNDESVTTFGLYLGLAKVVRNTDIKVGYDRSHSNNAFVYGGPRIQELSTNVALTPGDGLPCGNGSTAPCFKPLADVTNTWQQLRFDATYMIRDKYGFSVGYEYEKFDVKDFATTNLSDGSPRVDPLGAITTGYGNRPYKGQYLLLQFIYKFQPAGPLF